MTGNTDDELSKQMEYSPFLKNKTSEETYNKMRKEYFKMETSPRRDDGSDIVKRSFATFSALSAALELCKG